MKESPRFRLLLMFLVFVAWTYSPVKGASADRDQTRGKVQLSDESSALLKGATITVSFPTAMVQVSAIDVEAKTSPIHFEPALEGTFLWKSQTEGEFKLKEVPPGTTFKILLAPGLVDLDGKPVKSSEPIGSRSSSAFTVDAYFNREEKIGRRPAIPLQFSVKVRPSNLAETAWFQDRDSRKHYPVEVVVDEKAGDSVEAATVTPRTDLPAGRTFDLVVDGGLLSAETGTRLTQPCVIPLGETEALKVVKVAAFNYPMQPRRITVEFNEPVDPTEGHKIKIEPHIAFHSVGKGEELWLEGDFDIHQRYMVSVPRDIVGKSGFSMLADSQWGATFHPKKASLIFPAEDLHQRSQLGLRFAFMQVNTGHLQWKLARVPPDKLLAIDARVREFTEKQQDPIKQEDLVDEKTGLPVWTKSELLIDASHLNVVANGEINASPEDADTRREIAWKPERGLPAGAYLLEITSTNAEGKVIANRELITFTEYAATKKLFGDTCLLHVMSIGDGRSMPGVRARIVGGDNEFLAEAVTDADGMARFDAKAFPVNSEKRAKRFLLETPDGPVLLPFTADKFGASGFFSESEKPEETEFRVAIATDRPLYRPGQVLKFKGFVREVGHDGDLHVPHAREVEWKISADSEDVITRKTKLDDYGGFEGEWMVPKISNVGQYQISANFQNATGQQYVEIQEFRPPPFLVSLSDLKLSGTQAGIRIASVYFHGAANAGAHVQWKAIWTDRATEDSRVVITDVPKEASGRTEGAETVTGEGVLAYDGSLEVKSFPPFKDGIPRGWYNVEWSASVTAADGQTIDEATTFPVYTVPVQLSVSGVQSEKAGDQSQPMTVDLKADADGPDDKPVADVPVSVELYRVINKTAKEQISPNVYRYRNSVAFEKGETYSGRTPFKKTVPVKMAGEYLAVVRQPENPAVPAVDGRVFVAGAGEAEFSYRDEESIGVTCDRGDDTKDPKNSYTPGETAVISVQAPFSGIAWVTVETDRILDTMIVPLDENSGQIRVPIKKEYAPNVWVSVYLLHPGGADQLPAERFGSVEIGVRRPDVELKVTPVLASKQLQPKETVSGEIQVSSENAPVADADLTVYAIDEAVLDAGGWHEPPLRDTMYPKRSFSVGTYHGLESLSSRVETASLHQKGFILGDTETASKEVAADMNVTELRTNFPPLAFWKTHLRTDRVGKVAFSFKAPDSLTKYRVIALAQTKQGQFGTGSDWVELSKPLQIEPALPRFLRVGDEVELRAIVRQKIADELPVTVNCTTNLKLVAGNSQKQTVRRGVPSVFRFKAVVGELGTATIRFETRDKSGDAVELSLPVHPPTLIRKEALFGKLTEVQQRIPEDWTKSSGQVDVSLSTSPWLPKLTGLPLLLEYPHGCFEQITSRILGYTALRDLLAYIPEPTAREDAYRTRIEAGIKQMSDGLTTDGYLPYWPGSQPCALTTVAGYWAIANAPGAGIAVPGNLTEALLKSVRSIALGEKHAPADSYSRAFALMVLSEHGKDVKTFAPVIREIYQRRESLEDDSRAFLAIAMHRFDIMPVEKQQLLREIDRPLEERAFDPDTFGSTTRTEAIRALAFAIIDPTGTSGKARDGLRARIDELLDSSQSLSTQENFWLLLAFKTMHASAQSTAVAFHSATPVPTAISHNGASALWSGLDIRNLQKFAVHLEKSDALTCLMEARFQTDSPVTQRTDNGLRVERVVKNMTDQSRTGTTEMPFHLGDQILITYRVISPKLQHYVALEDELPAALETINPDIASIARTYSVPQDKDTRRLYLSFSELKDQITCLYFDQLEPGVSSYSVLARVTCAGAFHWPATQVVPMYDSRFSGLSPSAIVHASGE